MQWNEASLKCHCRCNKQQIFVCPAEDRIHGQPLTAAEQLAVKLRSLMKNRQQGAKKDLPQEI